MLLRSREGWSVARLSRLTAMSLARLDFIKFSIIIKESNEKNISNILAIIVDRIQAGDFSGVEISALLIYVRYADPYSKILNELGNFIAHYDERTEGILYDHLDKFMLNFINFAVSGSSVTISGPLFNQEQIIEDLISVIKKNVISGFDETQFRTQSFKIMEQILQIVSETKIINSKVVNCRFSSVEETEEDLKVFFCFGPIKGTVLNVMGETKIPALIATRR